MPTHLFLYHLIQLLKNRTVSKSTVVLVDFIPELTKNYLELIN